MPKTPAKRTGNRRRSVRRRLHQRDTTHRGSGKVYQQEDTPTGLALGGNEGALVALYVVQPTDTLERIVDRFGVPLHQFIAVNPGVAGLGRVYRGQIVQVPIAPPVLPITTRVATEYIVQEGDTLFSIAQQFRIGLRALQKVNPLVNPDRIFMGQLLLLPLVAEPPAMAVPGLLYVVQPGDTPTMIAGLFGFSISDFNAANPQRVNPQRVNPQRLVAGEIVVLPVVGVPEIPVFDSVRTIVQPMEGIPEIARQFEVWPLGIGRLNAIVAAIPGLLLQLPPSIAVPDPPPQPEGMPECRPAPFGRRLELGDDDTTFVPFPEDFRTTFFGNERSEGLWVNSNGNVTFEDGDPTFYPTTDTFIEGPARIAPFWSDVVPPAAVGTGGVFVDFFFDPHEEGTRLVITWDRLPIFGIERFFTFQMLLSSDGTIEFCYFDIPPFPEEVEPPRVFVGIAPGNSQPGSDIFIYNAHDNQRRAGDTTAPTPRNSLSQRVLLYRYDEATGKYRFSFS